MLRVEQNINVCYCSGINRDNLNLYRRSLQSAIIVTAQKKNKSVMSYTEPKIGVYGKSFLNIVFVSLFTSFCWNPICLVCHSSLKRESWFQNQEETQVQNNQISKSDRLNSILIYQHELSSKGCQWCGQQNTNILLKLGGVGGPNDYF